MLLLLILRPSCHREPVGQNLWLVQPFASQRMIERMARSIHKG